MEEYLIYFGGAPCGSLRMEKKGLYTHFSACCGARQGRIYSLVLEGNNKCLEIDPEFVFAMFNIANVYAKSGEIQKAIDMYTKVLEVDKDIAEAYFNRGLLYIYQGNRSAANVDLSKAGELGLTDSYSIIKRYCSVEEE